MKSKGFTLIELLVVISIVALLSSIVLASLNSARDKARLAAGKQFSSNIHHVAADEALGIWSADECSGTTLTDLSGNGRTGVLTNGATWSTDSPLSSGCSLSLDGTDDYVTMGNGKLAPRTVSAWIYIDPASPSDERDVFTNWGPGGSNNLVFKIDNFRLGIYANSMAESFYVSSQLSTGRWYHVAYVNRIDGTKSKLFIDGQEAASVNGTTFGTGTNNWLIGANDNGTARFWRGRIDDVRIYDKSITAGDIEYLYANGINMYKFANE